MEPSDEVRRHALQRRHRVERQVLGLAQAIDRSGLEARIAARHLVALAVLMQGVEAAADLDEILDHPDLLIFEDYGHRWYGA